MPSAAPQSWACRRWVSLSQGPGGSVRDADGIDQNSLRYTWFRCNSNGSNCDTEVATGQSYSLTRADVGKRLRLRLQFSDDNGVTGIRTGAPWPGAGVIGTTPVPVSLEVVRDRLDVTFQQDLKTDAVPPAGAFAVNVNLQPVAVSEVGMVGSRSVRLTHARRVSPGEAVTITYLRPIAANQRLQNAEGDQSASFAGRSVRNVAPVNVAATGAPVISGTAEVGEVLTAGPGTISDGNELTNSSFSYRWIRVGDDGEADIPGATGSTYTVSGDDVGKRLKVRAVFEDDAHYSEARTSEATGVVPDTVGPRLLGGGASVEGATLTLQFDEPLDVASEPAASAFAVIVAGSPASVSAVSIGGDRVSLTLAAPVVRAENVTVSYTSPTADPIRDALGNEARDLVSLNVANLTLAVPGAPTIVEATPAYSEIAMRLRAPVYTGGADITGFQFRYAEGASVPEATAWADAVTLTVAVAGEQLHAVTVSGLRNYTAYAIEVRAVNSVGGGCAASTTVTTTSSPFSGNVTGRPEISSGSVALSGRRATATRGHAGDPEGIDESTLRYTWLRCNANGDNCSTAITTGSSVTLTDADVGLRLLLRLEFTDNSGGTESPTSFPWPSRSNNPIGPAGGSPGNASGNPAIAGDPMGPGFAVTVDRRSISDPQGVATWSMENTWFRCDAAGENCTEQGTTSMYQLGSADLGSRLKARVDFQDDDGNPEWLTTPLRPPCMTARSAPMPPAAPKSWVSRMSASPSGGPEGARGIPTESTGPRRASSGCAAIRTGTTATPRSRRAAHTP